MEQIAKEQLVNRFDYEPKKESGFCEPCIDGNQSTLPFPKTGGERSDELLDIVHSDVCGKIETKWFTVMYVGRLRQSGSQ